VDIVLLFLRREVRDIRGNARVWPLYLILPVIGIGLPALFAVLGSVMAGQAVARRDAATLSLLESLQEIADFAGMAPAEALTRFLVRSAAGFLLIIPVAISSTSAAFSIVGEKQQRTLEPILATPITDRQFLLGKLLASLAPTVVITWATGVAASVVVDVITWRRFGPLLPDRYWLLGVGLLAPLLGAIVVLVTMRLSAKSTDPQATVQTTALAILPGFFLAFGLFGRLLTVSFPALGVACLLATVLAIALFRANVVKFKREEILTKWK
jgi:ABC-2 type transport system permease protein